MLLKIKADQVINENNFPIKTEHGNLDSIVGFTGDLVITMDDLAGELKDKVPYALGIRNIVDKAEMKAKLEEFLCYQTVILFLNEYGGASGADRDFMLGEKN